MGQYPLSIPALTMQGNQSRPILAVLRPSTLVVFHFLLQNKIFSLILFFIFAPLASIFLYIFPSYQQSSPLEFFILFLPSHPPTPYLSPPCLSSLLSHHWRRKLRRCDPYDPGAAQARRGRPPSVRGAPRPLAPPRGSRRSRRRARPRHRRGSPPMAAWERIHHGVLVFFASQSRQSASSICCARRSRG
jgi:hypothetical protein